MNLDKFKAFMGRASGQVEDLWPAVLEWDGVDFPCACGGARRELGLNMDRAGMEVLATASVRVSKVLMVVPPRVGDVVFYSGILADGTEGERVECHVESVSEREWDVSWTVALALC